MIEKVWENPVNFEVKVSTQTLVTGKGVGVHSETIVCIIKGEKIMIP